MDATPTTSPGELRRRTFIGSGLKGIGSLSLASLLSSRNAEGSPTRGLLDAPHYRPRIKRVIHLYMAGGPSHLETLDPKPLLREMNGKPMPESITKGQQIAQLQGKALNIMGSPFGFKRFGHAGLELCELFPHLGGIADEMCVVRSMQTEQINHDPAHMFMNTGHGLPGRPSMGAWLLYGLGQDTENLPGFVVLTSVGRGGQAQPIASKQWHSGFLPSRFQGVPFNSVGDPVNYITPPAGYSLANQRTLMDSVGSLNSQFLQRYNDPEIATRLAQYELAFNMQTSVPELTDMSDESQTVLDMYGAKPGDGSFASNCLLARRLAERGTRFIQVYHRAWDHHGNIKGSMEITAKEVDQASAALVKDLKQRGMLDDTLVIWGGEFGRTPMAQGNGRDHHIRGFSLWMAGGGVKPGFVHGATDEFGYNATENIVHVRDFHATLLHLFGIDHERLTYKFQGLDFRLTGVEPARVVFDILA